MDGTGKSVRGPLSFEKGQKPALSLITLAHFLDIKWWLVALSMFSALIAAAFEGISLALLIPIFQGLIDGKFESFLRTRIWHYEIADLVPFRDDNSWLAFFLLCLLLLTVLVKTVFRYASSIAVAYQTRHSENFMRTTIFRRFLTFGKHYFDQQNVGRLHQLLMTYTRELGAVPLRIQDLLYQTICLVAYFTLLLLIDWQLTLAVLLCFPVLHHSVAWLITKIKKSSNVSVGHANIMGQQLNNALLMLPFVRLSNCERQEAERFEQVSGQVARLDFGIDKKTMLIGPINEIVITAVLFVIICSIGLLRGSAGIGNLGSMAVFLYTLRRASYSTGLINVFRSLCAEVSGRLAEVVEVFDDEGKHIICDGSHALSGFSCGIEIRELTFGYGMRAALCDVSLSIDKGAFVALVGRSGSGKSTLLSLLLRLYDPPSGAIFIDGVDLRDLKIADWRSLVAFVPQEPYLFHATFRENLLYGLDPHMDDTSIMEVLESLELARLVARLHDGLDTLIGDRGVQLSGGERQRLAFARALLKKPQVLILDEPTSAMDSKTEELIHERLQQLPKERTLIVAAHRLSTIAEADRIVVLEQGRILEQGSIEELLAKRGAFFTLWRAQTCGGLDELPASPPM